MINDMSIVPGRRARTMGGGWRTARRMFVHAAQAIWHSPRVDKIHRVRPGSSTITTLCALLESKGSHAVQRSAAITTEFEDVPSALGQGATSACAVGEAVVVSDRRPRRPFRRADVEPRLRLDEMWPVGRG